MKWRYIVIFLVIIAAVVLYFLTRSFVYQDRYANAENILHLYRGDALILNQNILRTRYGFLPHYDPLISSLQHMSQLQSKLNKFIKENNAPGVEYKNTLAEKLIIKKRLVIAFLRNHSILRNSVIYLPIAISILTTQNIAHSDLLNNLLLSILLKTNPNISSNKNLTTKINNIIEQFPKTLTKPDPTAKNELLLTNTLKHSKTILNYHPRLNTVTRQLLEINLVNIIDNLDALYQAEREKYIARNTIFRILLFTLFLSLISIITYIIIHLRKSIQLQAHTNDKLSSKLLAQRQVEKAIKFQNATLIETNEKFINEITKHKKQSALLNKAQLESKQQQQEKNVFIASMAHKISHSVDNMLSNLKQQPITNDVIADVKQTGEELLRFLANTIDYAKLSANMLVLQKTKFDFGLLITSNAKKYQTMAAAKQLKFNLSMPADHPQKLIGDPVYLTKILDNLLYNAVKNTTEGQIDLIITYKIVDNNQSVFRFDIKDTGIGIDAAKRAHLLNSDHNDYGLGLICCRKIITLMGGIFDIDIANDVPGTTVCFSVRLPIAD